MNRILFEEKAARYSLDPRDKRFEHVRGVLRMGVGDSFDVGCVNGPVGKATVRSLDAESLDIDVEWGDVPPKPPPVHLLVGMCRPATARKILVTAPTLGVRELSFVPCTRSDPAYEKSGLWTSGEWRARLIEGVEQAFDTQLPELLLPDSLDAAVKRVPARAHKLALDVYEETDSLSAVMIEPGRPVCLAIGPERGWAKPDRDRLRAAGFTLVSLGTRVMRVETAVTAGLALVLAKMGQL
jgi:RsmE family RNA methyltransferase